MLACVVRPAARKCLTASLFRMTRDARLQLRPEMPNQPLNRPRKSLAQRTDRVSLDLLSQLLHHINLPRARRALLKSLHNLLRPFRTFAARSALAARFVVVELRQPRDRADDVCALIHDDDSRGAESTLAIFQRVEIHDLRVARSFGQDGRGGAAGDDGFEVVPAAAHAAAVLVDELAEGDGHFFLHRAGVVDVAGDAEEFRAGVALAAEGVEPVRPAPDDGGSDGDGLDVRHGAGAAEEADSGREGGLEAGFTGLALEGLDQRGFFAADVGAHAAVQVDIEVVAGAAGVFADEAGFVGFLDGALQDGGFVVEFAADVDVGCCALYHHTYAG